MMRPVNRLAQLRVKEIVLESRLSNASLFCYVNSTLQSCAKEVCVCSRVRVMNSSERQV